MNNGTAERMWADLEGSEGLKTPSLTLTQWDRPSHVELDRGHVHSAGAEPVEFSSAVLREFVQLATADDDTPIADYVSRFGRIGFCEPHGLPARHNPPNDRARPPNRAGCWVVRDVHRHPGIETFSEPAGAYRRMALYFDALYDIAALLRNKTAPPRDLWEECFAHRDEFAHRGFEPEQTPETRFLLNNYARETPGQQLASSRGFVTHAIGDLLSWADLRPSFSWQPDSEEPTFEYERSTLYGVLVLELASAIAGIRGWARCAGCRDLFQQRQGPGRPRKFCATCGDRTRYRLYRREERSRARQGS